MPRLTVSVGLDIGAAPQALLAKTGRRQRESPLSTQGLDFINLFLFLLRIFGQRR